VDTLPAIEPPTQEAERRIVGYCAAIALTYCLEHYISIRGQGVRCMCTRPVMTDRNRNQFLE